MPSYKVTYFDLKGMGEPLRFMLSYMGEKFEDDRLQKENWPALKPKTPYGKVPLLEVDGKVCCQSVATCRLLAAKAGLLGATPEENYEIDMIVDVFGDLKQELTSIFRASPEEKEKVKEKVVSESIPFYMGKVAQRLKDNKGYLANGKLSWADIYVVASHESSKMILGFDIGEKCSEFKALQERVKSLPGIKEWVAKRPEGV